MCHRRFYLFDIISFEVAFVSCYRETKLISTNQNSPKSVDTHTYRFPSLSPIFQYPHSHTQQSSIWRTHLSHDYPCSSLLLNPLVDEPQAHEFPLSNSLHPKSHNDIVEDWLSAFLKARTASNIIEFTSPKKICLTTNLGIVAKQVCVYDC